MEIWVYNQLNNQREVLKVGDGLITIGRDDDNTVTLRSPFVSRRHSQIVYEEGNYFVESLGLNGTTVANKLVAKGQRCKIDFGDEIRLGEYSLYMMEPSVRRISGAARAMSPRRRVIELEQKMHQELLDQLNLRVTSQAGGVDEAHVALIKNRLSQIIQSHFKEVDEAMAKYLAREFLWRNVVTELTRRSTGKMLYGYGFEDSDVLNPKHEEALARLIGDIVGNFTLRLRPHTLKEDVAAIEADWETQMRQAGKRITPELRDYLVHRMLSKEIEDVVLGYGPLQDLLEMPNVNEVMVVGKDRIYIEKEGVLQDSGRSFFSEEILVSIIERIITPVGRRIDRSTPLVDARLPDGSRVNAIINPLSLSGPALTIRKFARIPFTIDDLIERGTLTEKTAAFLRACVLGRKNLIIAGGTGSGKTTTLNVLSHFIPREERIITIEDSAELQLPQEHLVSLETRPANIEGRGAYTIRDLVKNALRMRPDRLIVGECRGPEALDMLQAMNTGHDGSLTTIHANTPDDTMLRLETMVLMAVEMPIRAIREQITAALDVVVQISRMPDGGRRVTHVSEISGIDPETEQIITEDIFVLRDPHDKTKASQLRHTGYIPIFTEELMEKGFLDVGVFHVIAIALAVEDLTGTGQMIGGAVLGAFTVAAVLVGYRPFKGVVASREQSYERDLQGALMIDIRPRSVTYLTGLGMLLTAIVGYFLLGGWVGGVLGLIVGAFLPPLAIRYLRRRRVAKLDEQLVPSIRTLASGVRAGLNLVQAMQLVARDGAVPVCQEYNHMMREYEYGVPLEQAMSNAARRIGSSDYQLLFAALLTHRERGGDLGETLDRIAESILEIQRLESRVRTLTAQGRTTARWLATMPAVVLGILYVIEPVWVQRLFSLEINGHANVVGNLIIGTIVILNIAGYVWIRKIVAIDI